LAATCNKNGRNNRWKKRRGRKRYQDGGGRGLAWKRKGEDEALREDRGSVMGGVKSGSPGKKRKTRVKRDFPHVNGNGLTDQC